MKTHFATKWALFSVLAGTVALNLNWNPDSTIIARTGKGRADLAQTSPNKEESSEIGSSQIIKVKQGVVAEVTVDKRIEDGQHSDMLLIKLKYIATESSVCEDCLNTRGLRSLEISKADLKNFDLLRIKILEGLVDDKLFKEEPAQEVKKEEKKEEKLVWETSCEEDDLAETVNERNSARIDNMRCLEDEFIEKARSCDADAKEIKDKKEKKKLQAACIAAARDFFKENLAQPMRRAFSGQLGQMGVQQAIMTRNGLLNASGRYTESFLAAQLSHLSSQGLVSQANAIYLNSLQQGLSQDNSLSFSRSWLEYQANAMILGTQGNSLYSSLMNSTQFQDNAQAIPFMESVYKQEFQAPIQAVVKPANPAQSKVANFSIPEYNDTSSDTLYSQYVGSQIGSSSVSSAGSINRSGGRQAPLVYNPIMARASTTTQTSPVSLNQGYAMPSQTTQLPSYIPRTATRN